MKQDFSFLKQKWFTQVSLMALVAAFFTYLYVTYCYVAIMGFSVYWHLFYRYGQRAVFFYKHPQKIKLLHSSHAKRAFYKNYFMPISIGTLIALSTIFLINKLVS